jgi:hypothetical protein
MSVMVIRTMSWHEKVGRCLFLLCCLTWASATAQVEEKTEAQTSPKGTRFVSSAFRSTATDNFSFFVAAQAL